MSVGIGWFPRIYRFGRFHRFRWFYRSRWLDWFSRSLWSDWWFLTSKLSDKIFIEDITVIVLFAVLGISITFRPIWFSIIILPQSARLMRVNMFSKYGFRILGSNRNNIIEACFNLPSVTRMFSKLILTLTIWNDWFAVWHFGVSQFALSEIVIAFIFINTCHSIAITFSVWSIRLRFQNAFLWPRSLWIHRHYRRLISRLVPWFGNFRICSHLVGELMAIVMEIFVLFRFAWRQYLAFIDSHTFERWWLLCLYVILNPNFGQDILVLILWLIVLCSVLVRVQFENVGGVAWLVREVLWASLVLVSQVLLLYLWLVQEVLPRQLLL